MPSLTLKTIRVTIALAAGGSFGEGNAVVIEGLPVTVKIAKPGGDDQNKCAITVAGLALDKMEKITSLAFRPLQTRNNKIKVEAGVRGAQLANVFSGEIVSAVPEFDTAGSATMKIEASAGWFPNQLPTGPTSVKAGARIADLMNQFAAEAGYTFKNEGVSGSVGNSVFRGSPLVKARALARQTGIELLIDDGKLVIIPKGQAIQGQIPLLNKESGLLGYPSFSKEGVNAKTIYDPRIELGGRVKIESVVPLASGIWKISKLEHGLTAYHSKSGEWETTFSAVWAG